jgi:hypothetical protein
MQASFHPATQPPHGAATIAKYAPTLGAYKTATRALFLQQCHLALCFRVTCCPIQEELQALAEI